VEAKFKASLQKENEKVDPQKEDNEFIHLVNSAISGVTALYNSMQQLFMNRREISSAVIKEKIKSIGNLQDELVEKTKSLVASKDTIIDQEKAISKMKSEQSLFHVSWISYFLISLQFNGEMANAELKAKLSEHERVISAFKDKHVQSEKVISELMHRNTGATSVLEDHKRTIGGLEKNIKDLEKTVENYKKQQESNEVAMAAIKYQLEKQRTGTPPVIGTLSRQNTRYCIDTVNWLLS
jgi:hypothetical protein